MASSATAEREWTVLLFRTSKEIHTECLDDLKFLMKDSLSESEQEGIEKPRHLMRILEKKNLISVQDCSYLVTMLIEANNKKLADTLEKGRKKILQKYGKLTRYYYLCF